MGDPSRWLDIESAASYLSLRPDTFQRKVKARQLPAPSKHLGERSPRWDRAALDAMMEGNAGSSSHRDTFNAIAAKIATEGRKNSPSHARGRHGQNLPLRQEGS